MFYNFAYEVCLGFPNVCKVAYQETPWSTRVKKVLRRRIYRQVVVMYLESMK